MIINNTINVYTSTHLPPATETPAIIARRIVRTALKDILE